jgi:uncharacterized protein
MNARQPPAGFDPADISPPPWRERDWPVTSLALDLSGHCNLACRYCAESATQPQHRPRMERGLLQRALALLEPQLDAGTATSIRLGSGEPLLAKPLLRELDRWLRKRRQGGRAVPEVFVTTNGTLLDPATRDWLAATGWRIKVSLDGPAAIHDRWRVSAKGRPTYEAVAAAVTDLAERLPERLSVTAVLCRGNDPERVFSAIAGLGVRRIELVPVAHPDASILPRPDDLAAYSRFVQDYVSSFVAGEPGLAELVRVINGARRAMGYDVKRVTCGAGRNFLGLAADGGLYPCFRFVGCADFRLGELPAGPEPQRQRRFAAGAGRPYEQREDCKDCWAASLCGGPCFAEAELLGPGGGRPFALHCEYVKADAAAALTLTEQLRERDPERLLELLAGLIEL